METFNDPFGVIGDGAWGGAPVPEDQPLKFAQGKVIAWQPLDGTNTVRIQGVDFPNLPVMSSSEAVQIRVGDVVGCLKYLNTYMILGRVSPPTIAAQRGGAIQAARQISPGESIATAGWVNPGTGPGPQVAVDIGPARRALVLMSLEGYVNRAELVMSFQVTGASNIAPGSDDIQWAWMASGVSSGVIQEFMGSTSSTTVLTAAQGLNSGMNYFASKFTATAYAGTPTGSNTYYRSSLVVMPF